MRIFDENKQNEIYDYDLSIGRLKSDTLIKHIPKIDAVEEQGHYETIAEYPNGGKDVKWVVDVEGVDFQEEHDEVENILVYIPYTADELRKREIEARISNLKQQLLDTDYKAIKYAEGELTAEEYAETKAQRKAWRAEINQLEQQLQ